MTDETFRAQMASFLASCRAAGLATVDENGRPHAVNLWYASDADLNLFFVSKLETAHSCHILRDRSVALTIYAETDDPMHIHGLQIHGRCGAIPPPPEGEKPVWDHAWEVYTGKFPFVAENQQFRDALSDHSFWKITPTWLRWLDNRKGFGFKVERRLPFVQ